jgi:hypothetical protein
VIIETFIYLAQAEGEDDKCELPRCMNKKRVEGTRVFDYCSRQHAAQDEPGREGINGCNKSVMVRPLSTTFTWLDRP